MPTPFADLDDYLALPRVSGLAVSPDGSRVVTTVAELNDKRTEYFSAIWELDRSWLVSRSDSYAVRTVLAAGGGCCPVDRRASSSWWAWR
jgi:hypothetical protein